MKGIKLNKKIILCITIIIVISVAVYIFMVSKLQSHSLEEDSINVARKSIEQLANEEYTIKLELIDICIDKVETQRIINRYRESELSKRRGWSNKALDNMVAVKVCYYAEFDHAMTFRDDGYTEQYYYVMTDELTNKRIVAEYSSPYVKNA